MWDKRAYEQHINFILLCMYKLGINYYKITCKEQERVLGQTTLRSETVMEIDYWTNFPHGSHAPFTAPSLYHYTDLLKVATVVLTEPAPSFISCAR